MIEGDCMQEIGVYELGCTVRVDEFGFFIYWKSDGKVRTIAPAAHVVAGGLWTKREKIPPHGWKICGPF